MLIGRGVSTGGMSALFRCGQFNSSEKCCPSADLSLDSGQRHHLFSLDWLVYLLVLSYQLPGDVIQALIFMFLCTVVPSARLARKLM